MAKHNGRTVDVFKVTYKEGDKVHTVKMNPSIPLTEYINGIQMYNTSENTIAQGYFERDPFTRRQNEIIKTIESHPKIQKEYSILKDIKLTSYITKFLYSLVDPKYKKGGHKLRLIETFKQVSKEDEIRALYNAISTADPLVNPLDFKDLGIEKWDRVNWLTQKKLINI
jgi:hypothetical protein